MTHQVPALSAVSPDELLAVEGGNTIRFCIRIPPFFGPRFCINIPHIHVRPGFIRRLAFRLGGRLFGATGLIRG